MLRPQSLAANGRSLGGPIEWDTRVDFEEAHMTKYQLAKLVLMARGLPSRKRIQKTVHLLQAAGCDLGACYRLHYYGPYSADVAALLDRLTTEGILLETEQQLAKGPQYDYRFNDEFLTSLQAHEDTAVGKAAKEQLERYGDLLGALCRSEPKTLELASTITHFVQQGQPWEQAVLETSRFRTSFRARNAWRPPRDWQRQCAERAHA